MACEQAAPLIAPTHLFRMQSWFDDRVECRNALSKLSYLTGVKDLKRDYLPWTRCAGLAVAESMQCRAALQPHGA